METLTQSGLRDMLYGLRGSVPLTISALTRVPLPKKAGYVGEVLKLARINGLAGTDTMAAMERMVTGYKGGSRPWGERISPALVQGPNGVYLSLRIKHRLATVYLARHGSLLKTMRENELAGLLKPDTRPIEVREYSLRSIKRIAINGKRYRIVDDGMEP